MSIHRSMFRSETVIGPYDNYDYPGRHRAHRRDMRVVANTGQSMPNLAVCSSEMRARIEGLNGSLAGRLLRVCRNETCAHHHPEAYASHMAKHTPESIKMHDSVLLTLGEIAARRIMMGDW